MISPKILPRLIFDQGKKSPEALALLSPGKKGLPYQQLSQQVSSIALQLTRLGMHAGDRLAVVLPNGAEMAGAFLAISAVCTCAPLNPAYPMGWIPLEIKRSSRVDRSGNCRNLLPQSAGFLS
jgi:non-ribosomal peptide synthetase component F